MINWFDLFVQVYVTIFEPLIVSVRKRPRLEKWQSREAIKTLHLNLLTDSAFGSDGLLALKRFQRIAKRYDISYSPEDENSRSRRSSPMMLDLATCQNLTGYEQVLRSHSNRTLPKIRKAQRMPYSVQQFALPVFVHDVHEIKTCMAFRSCGPVPARWLLKPETIATPSKTLMSFTEPLCPTHWTVWWGVFQTEPGHMNGALQTDKRLVAYIKLSRYGDMVHYLDIMGHKDHLENGVMLLLHNTIVSWLMEETTAYAKGVKAVWYGAIEHGAEGLITWKKRAGFVPVKVKLYLNSDSAQIEKSSV